MTDERGSQEYAGGQTLGRMHAHAADTEVISISASETYRHLARTLPEAGDTVLEIGCSTGAATRCMIAAGARVVAVDKSVELIGRLQQEMEGNELVVAACLDGRNIPGLTDLAPSPDLIFVDIGGDARLDVVGLQVRLCLRAFRPRAMVVRSFELASLAALIGQVEPPELAGLQPSERPLGRDMLANLLDLSRSTSTDTRCFAARRLARLQDERARQRLEEMTADPHHKVRRAAARSLAP